jgi:hypothetical protein
LSHRSSPAACAAVAAVAVLAAAAPGFASERAVRKRVVAVEGLAKHRRDMRVEILVVVPAGTNARAAGNRALARQHARRLPALASAAWTGTGLVWNRLPVVQNYNPAGQATTGARTALTNTYGQWNSVPRSAYRIRAGGTTGRCPSLVQGCSRRYDGYNDVGWSQLSGGTLAVTWYGTSVDEADMAVNTRYAWSTGCVQRSGAYDLQTVYLHENGHVPGLGHSSIPSAVMYPSYRTARCTLGADDRNGLAAIY